MRKGGEQAPLERACLTFEANGITSNCAAVAEGGILAGVFETPAKSERLLAVDRQASL